MSEYIYNPRHLPNTNNGLHVQTHTHTAPNKTGSWIHHRLIAQELHMPWSQAQQPHPPVDTLLNPLGRMSSRNFGKGGETGVSKAQTPSPSPKQTSFFISWGLKRKGQRLVQIYCLGQKPALRREKVDYAKKTNGEKRGQWILCIQ